jgi:hypothetical protein
MQPHDILCRSLSSIVCVMSRLLCNAVLPILWVSHSLALAENRVVERQILCSCEVMRWNTPENPCDINEWDQCSNSCYLGRQEGVLTCEGGPCDCNAENFNQAFPELFFWNCRPVPTLALLNAYPAMGTVQRQCRRTDLSTHHSHHKSYKTGW